MLAILSGITFYTVQLYSWHLDQQGVTQLFQQTLKASIHQYEYLPALLATNQHVKTALQYSQKNHTVLNQHLAFITQRSGASNAYVMNMSGKVIASSNHNKTNSFINKNYSFRPYFKQAIAQNTAPQSNFAAVHKTSLDALFPQRFYYAIGATTGTPGFFISEPVMSNHNTLLGVVVVKLNLSHVEKVWQQSQQNILLSDDNNVVILSGRPEWRYRTIGLIPKPTLKSIKEQRQFSNKALNNLVINSFKPELLTHLNSLFWRIEDGLYFVNYFNIKGSGWTLYTLKKNNQFVQSTALFFILLLSGLILAYLYVRERQSKHRSRLRAEQEIKRVNASLEEKVEKRTKALRDTQEELVQQSKVAALGKMAATIVHELSQPLSAMNSSIAAINLKTEKNDWAGATKSIGRLSKLSRKMNAVIKLLKSFSYQDDKEIQQQPLAPLIKKSLLMYKDCLKEKNVVLTITSLENDVFVKVNPIKFDLVITNIIQNAMDAMEKCEEPRIAIAMQSQQQHATITIEDNGGGINSRIMGQLFNPYFTTKEIGKGLGLGLSICYEIIREYGGNIEVNNLPQGAQFIIKLPIHIGSN